MLRPGAQVWCDDEIVTLVELKSLKEVVLQKADGEKVTRPASEVKYNRSGSRHRRGDLVAIDPEKWRNAWDISRHVRELLTIPDAERTTEDVDKVAKFLGKSRATVYRWLDNYRKNGSISALLRKPREDVGSSRLDARVEQITSKHIRTSYLTENRRSMASVAKDIKEECLAQKLAPPDASTVRARIYALDPKLVAEKRYGKKYADERYNPLMGSFPNANYPLAVVQIDHTPMDVIVVDEIWRKAIQRPYLTIRNAGGAG